MPEEADSGLVPASDAGSDFTGDLGLPTPADTEDQAAGSPAGEDPAKPTDSSAGTVEDGETVATPEVKYTALGREWDSEDAFAQHYKSMEGRVRAQGQENAKLNNTIDQWERWHNYQETLTKDAATKTESAESKKKSEPFLDAIDWGAVQRLSKEKGFEHAMQAVVIGLQDHIQKEVVEKYDAKLAEATEPIRAQSEARAADTEAKNWFFDTANSVDPETGTPLFPELYEKSEQFDTQTATAIVNAWGNLVRTHPQFGLTRDGVEYAVTIGLKEIASAAKPAADAKKVAKDVTRDAQGKFIKQAEQAVKEEASGGVDTSDVVGGSAKLSEADQIRKDIRTAGKADSKAGFFGIA